MASEHNYATPLQCVRTVSANETMKYLIAVVALSLSALGAESTNVAVDDAQAKPPASPAEIAQRSKPVWDGWILSEADRDKLSITVTNWQGVACASPSALKVTTNGLLVVHESHQIWCEWEWLPPETRAKYQSIVAEAQKNGGNSNVRVASPDRVVVISSPPPSPAPASGSKKKVTRLDDGTYAPTKSPPPSATGYWLTTYGGLNIRHNSSCKSYGNPKQGKACKPTAGKACPICGG